MWVCCQLGAREHYSVPRALRLRNELGLLVTDVWTGERGTIDPLRPLLGDRFHPGLSGSPVAAFNWDYRRSEIIRRLRYNGWNRLLARNDWFQQQALSALQSYARKNPDGRTVLFAYSYAARRLLEFGRDEGWTTVLGQIDGGPAEERLVIELGSGWAPAPAEYWSNWREECSLADEIVINSEWSRRCMDAGGIAGSKVKTIPLAYEQPTEASSFVRQYPASFTAERPLRVLFLGQVNVRKGALAIFDALPGLQSEPVEFRMVGPIQLDLPPHLRNHPMLRWVGPVARSRAAAEYRRADVFLFPTFSDGFGMTQLEAQAWQLPVIASEFCGQVVRHLDNGYLLPAVSGAEIASAVRWCLRNPAHVATLSRQSCLPPWSNLNALGTELSALCELRARAV